MGLIRASLSDAFSGRRALVERDDMKNYKLRPGLHRQTFGQAMKATLATHAEALATLADASTVNGAGDRSPSQQGEDSARTPEGRPKPPQPV